MNTLVGRCSSGPAVIGGFLHPAPRGLDNQNALGLLLVEGRPWALAVTRGLARRTVKREWGC